MRRLAVILVLMAAAAAAWADLKAVTEDGRTVILRPNGTWFYEGEETKEPLQVIAHGSSQGEVFGRIRNNTETMYSWVTVTVDFFDKDGQMVDTDEEAIIDLRPGTFQSFKTLAIRRPAFASYEVYVSYYRE